MNGHFEVRCLGVQHTWPLATEFSVSRDDSIDEERGDCVKKFELEPCWYIPKRAASSCGLSDSVLPATGFEG